MKHPEDLVAIESKSWGNKGLEKYVEASYDKKKNQTHFTWLIVNNCKSETNLLIFDSLLSFIIDQHDEAVRNMTKSGGGNHGYIFIP
ncbi:MAG: hypothetical protein QM811_30375 [Pirellulales bacterium]